MLFIVPFLVCAAFVWVFILLLTGCVQLSRDRPEFIEKRARLERGATVKALPQKLKEPEKAYIDLNGRLIELHTRAEERQAKQNNFKVVRK